MKYLIPLILLFPSLAFAVDDLLISEIDVKASSANAKADSNNSRIQALEADIDALEAEDIILHQRIDTVESLPVGASLGDILYWDGSVWQLTLAPPNGAATPPTLNLIEGVPTWTESGAGDVYALGDTGPAGGIVFYITADGLHGLEAARVDQPSAEFGCLGTSLGGARSIRVGSGLRNHDAIMTRCGLDTAASSADEYTLNGYYDWYLPSQFEMTRVMEISHAHGYPLSTDPYWTSSTHITDSTYQRAFSVTYYPAIPGFGTGNAYRTSVYHVRPIRTF